ncbi:MAG: hypothetical protein GY898_33860 [Proteobacteria bacterium]|nr:hypothetical protein [Pseudomonadota bacterium]
MALLPVILAGSLLAPGPCVRLAGDDAPRGELRPVLSGPEQTVSTADGAWIVHWTDEGEDRLAALNDDDGNGRPDGLDAILLGLEAGTASFADHGYRTVVPDEGAGGTDAIDVYVRQIDAFGYAYPQFMSDEAGFSCYVELDPDNTDLGSETASSVASHEAHHCVQYAYTVQSHSWIYEATATYEQYLLFESPALDLALGVLWNQRLRGMDQPIDTTGERFEYAGFLLLKHLADRAGAEAPTRVWEHLAAEPDWEAGLDNYTREAHDEDLERAYTTWSLWNLFGCARDDGGHYDANTHPCTLSEVTAEVELLEESPEVVEFTHIGAYTGLLAELPGDGSTDPIEMACNVSPEGAEAEIALVALDSVGTGEEVAFGRAAAGEVLEVRLLNAVDSRGSIGIVSTSVGEVGAEVECGLARVAPFEEPGEDCSCSAGPRGAGWLGLLLVVLVGVVRRDTRERCSASR